MKSKLEQIINIGIEKGFDCFGYAKKPKFNINVLNYPRIIISYRNAEHSETLTSYCTGILDITISLTDLLFSPESNLMQALFGKELACIDCGNDDLIVDLKHDNSKTCGKCSCSWPINKLILAHRYHQQQLLPLNDQERISYIANALGVELDG